MRQRRYVSDCSQVRNRLQGSLSMEQRYHWRMVGDGYSNEDVIRLG
jgi:hypothetical protein